MLSSFVSTQCRNLNFLMVHSEWMEFHPSTIQATLLEYVYHCGICGFSSLSPLESIPTSWWIHGTLSSFPLHIGVWGEYNTTLHNQARWHRAQVTLEGIHTSKLEEGFSGFGLQSLPGSVFPEVAEAFRLFLRWRSYFIILTFDKGFFKHHVK